MLKGKTKVELFDAETGKLVKSVEKHNEITSAYQRLINHLFYTGGICDAFKNGNLFLKNIFGGIIMFDSDVPDGAIVQDKTNHCTGMAFYNQLESNYDKVGSYNSQESSIDYDKKTATFVYDFTTSQANGVVKSICLCNKDITMINGLNTIDTNVSSSNYGLLYLDKNNNMMLNGNDNYNDIYSNYYFSYPVSCAYYLPPLNNAYATIVVFFDVDNGVRYGIRFNGNKKFYAVKQYVAQNKWSAFVDTSQEHWQNRYNNVTKEEKVEVDLSGIYGGFETSDNKVKCYITGYKGVMYIMPVISSTQSGGTNLSILKYDFNNFGMESNEASFFNVLIPTGYGLWGNYDAGFYIDSEYVYYVVTNGTDYFVAKSSMANNADSKILQKVDARSPFSYIYIGWMPGTFVSNYTGYKTQFINLDDGSKSYSKLDPSGFDRCAKYIYDFRTDYIYYMDDYRYSGRVNYYDYYYYDYTLKSINNLTDAITKTSSNTMKITYTLTETDS